MAATKALQSVIEAATTVRCTVEAGQSAKAPAYLKKALDEYLDWAAADGGYDHLNVIPNVLVTVVDTNMPGEEISDWMIDQMDALAQRHRDYLRVDKDDGDSDKENRAAKASPPPVTSTLVKDESFRKPPVTPISDKTPRATPPDAHSGKGREEEAPLRQQGPDSTETAKTDSAPKVPARKTTPVEYHEPPPVLYGLFIMRTTVMVLTADAAKDGEDFVASYQVELGFGLRDQALWNAMTVGIIVCQARADMISRAALFSPRVVSDDSDPDPDA